MDTLRRISVPAGYIVWEIRVRDFKWDDIPRLQRKGTGLKKALEEIYTLVIKPCLPWIFKIPAISEQLRISCVLWEDNKFVRATLGDFVLIEYAKKISLSGMEYEANYECTYFFRNLPGVIEHFISENCMTQCELEPELDVIKVGIMPGLGCSVYRIGPGSVYFSGINPSWLIEKEETGELVLWSISESQISDPEELGILEIVDRINSSKRYEPYDIEV